ncbi:zinc-binding protein A33-like [Pristis pectinata]|uniref:zinc-binding protein A33-like n=1 Tax=Pristis pectinata TaxID=685728 RepID=UPI00223CCEA0|nr:zinc-binding protein A33-like [Pristis pectinata]
MLKPQSTAETGVCQDPVSLTCRSRAGDYIEREGGERRPCGMKSPTEVVQPNDHEQESVEEGCSPQQCQKHQQPLKLYCRTNKELLCVVCQGSKEHKNHDVVTVEKAVKEFKELLQMLLRPLQNRMNECKTSKRSYEKALTTIQERTDVAEKQIKKTFDKLHQFLCKEEKKALQKLKQDKKKKCQATKGKIEKINEEIASLSANIQELEQKLSEMDGVNFLREFPETEKNYRAKRAVTDTIKACPVVNVGNCVVSLQYRVWKKMLTVINTAPVVLDPCTAHPYLLLSEGFSSVSHTMQRQQPLCDCPERFNPCLSVLGREGFTSGKHHWEVVVGEKTEWDVGLVTESINRKEVTDLNPSNRCWIIALRDGTQYRAATKTWKHLDLPEKPKKIQVCLDYEGGKISFYNADNKTLIFTFTDRFTKRLYPYFSPGRNYGGKNAEPLKICPRKVTIQEE